MSQLLIYSFKQPMDKFHYKMHFLQFVYNCEDHSFLVCSFSVFECKVGKLSEQIILSEKMLHYNMSFEVFHITWNVTT